MGTKHKSGGGKLSRSETISVRLDPKLRYALELAAGKERRTLSSFIEWAVEKAVKEVYVSYFYDDNRPITAYDLTEEVWDVDEADRFAKLALSYPQLLVHEEQKLWKLICENGYLWKGRFIDDKWAWHIKRESLIFERLRNYWDNFKKVTSGEMDKNILPAWVDKKSTPEKDFGSDDPTETNSDIPF